MEKVKDTIYRQDAIDALDEIESEVADGDGFQYEKWRKHFCEMTSARPDHIADDSKRGDTINRKSAIEALHDEIVSRRINEDTHDDGSLDEFDTEAILRRLPSAQPEPSISLSWIDEQIERLKGMDNAFATLTAMQISVMVKKWSEEQDDS